MLIKKMSFFCLILFLIVKSHEKPIIEITIPKTGTHLLGTCLTLLTYRQMQPLITKFGHTPYLNNPKNRKYLISNLNKIKLLSNNSFFHTHLEHNKFSSELINSLKPIGFFLLRDPRDQIISFMHWYYKHHSLYPEYNNLNPDDVLCKIIKNTKKLYLSYLGWMKEPNILTIRFEDLIGPQGNGDQNKQINTILAIARHINFYSSKYRAKYIGNILFGNSKSFTFREGKIASWKKYFTNKHKKLCKKYIGQLLIDLRYEKDFNW